MLHLARRGSAARGAVPVVIHGELDGASARASTEASSSRLSASAVIRLITNFCRTFLRFYTAKASIADEVDGSRSRHLGAKV